MKEIIEALKSKLGKWYPEYTTMEELNRQAGGKWEETPISDVKKNSVKTAWAGLPEEAEQYLRSLPEFDEKIFNQITGRE